MGYFSHKIVLDMHSTVSQASLRVKLGDTNWKICAILTENGKTYNIPEGSTAIFTGKKADNTDLFNDCTIENNMVVYDFTEQTCAATGRVDCEIRLIDAKGKTITSPSFTIVVDDTVVDEDHIIESTDEVQALTNLINEVETKLENGEFVGEKGPKGDPGSVELLKTTDEQESALLGEELSSTGGTWTADGWTGSVASGFTHTSGNTNPLVFTPKVAMGTKLYQISFYSSVAVTTTNLMVRVGGSELFNLYGQADPISVGIRSAGDGVIEFIPESGFTGKLTGISIKEITGTYDGNFVIEDSRGNEAFIVRTTKASTSDSQNGENNIFVGRDSGEWNTSGYGNLGIGAGTLKNNTSGFWNVGLGYRALEGNTAGSRNIGIGYVSLLKNEVGLRNIAIGTHTLREHKSGDYNIAIGADSQLEGISGTGNVSIGHGTLYRNNGGNYNIAIGEGAISGGTSGASRGDNNVGIGHDCMMSVTGSDNVSIGRQAGYGLTSGNDNTFLGVCAGQYAAGCKRSVVIGASSGNKLTTGADMNVIIGNYTGNNITSGVGNITIGGNLNDSAKYSSYWLRIGHLLEGYMYPGASSASMRYLIVSGNLELPAIPTADPHIANRVWNDNGTLKVSAG